MKLRRINSDENFNPSLIVSNYDIFTRKTEIIEESGEQIPTM